MSEREPGRPILRKGVVRRRKADREAKEAERKSPRAGRDGGSDRPAGGADRKKSAPKGPPDRGDAEKLAQDRGIPYIHALSVIRGEVTLIEVLKDMVRKEHVDHLVTKERIAKSLAG